MNRYGRSGRDALSPRALCWFFAELERTPVFRDDVEGRTLRRWETAKGVTRAAAQRMFGCYNTSESEFREWCAARGIESEIRR